MIEYAGLKALHAGCAAASIVGFVARYFMMLLDSPMLQARAVRVLPHVVDTVLLASALGLVWQLSVNPLREPWLATKIAALLGYIVLGGLALRYGRTKALRASTGVLAIVLFAFIVSVARSKTAWGFLGG
jgi:uncharacterized membrane protein SirB2